MIMPQNLTICTHFNGSIINKYCEDCYRVMSYVTPSTNLSYQEDGLSNLALVLDYGLLYEACFTQTRLTVVDAFQGVLTGYYEHIESILLKSDRILVIGLITGTTAVSFFDHDLNNGYISQIDAFVTRVRSLLSYSYKGIYLSYEGRCVRDSRNVKMSSTLGATYDPDLFKLVGTSIDSFSKTLKTSCKAIIFDLDNTLWDGVVGEGFENTSLGNPNLDDSGYSLLRNYIRLAYETGIFTAICSKNDIDTLTEELNRSNHSYLLDYFTVIKANWRDKSKNIRDIANELNIGLGSCVFVDDNPRELHSVSGKIPEIFVVDAGNGPWETLNRLIESQYFARNLLLDDDVLRNKTTSQRIKTASSDKKSLKANNFGHEAEFYECDISLSNVQMRIEQLSLKTNQFNLATRRLSWRNINGLLCTEDFKILVYGGKDKYGDLGTIGYVLYKSKEGSVMIWFKVRISSA